MNTKQSFPDDWAKLSDKEVAEIVKHLRKNYKKYDISISSNRISIGNVNVFSYAKPKPDVPYKSIYSAADIEVCIEINNHSFVACDGAVFQDLQQLKQDCVRYYRRQKAWQKYGEKILLAIISAAFASAVAVGYVKYQQLEKAKTSSDTKVQNASQEYESQQAKTVNFIDSIHQKTK